MIPVLLICFAVVNLISASPLPDDKQYTLRLQPELDAVNVKAYLFNPRLLKLQISCLIFDGPCDVVGRWAKPRAKAALLGECLKCTETQKGWMKDWMELLINLYPDMYRAAIAKYLENQGVELSQEEKDKIEKAFGDEAIKERYKEGALIEYLMKEKSLNAKYGDKYEISPTTIKSAISEISS